MKKLTLLILVLLTLTGCSSMSAIFSKGAEINDSVVIASKATLCSAASFGAIKREFNTKEKAEALAVICSEDARTITDLLN